MEKKGYRFWRRLMLYGEKTGCHQRPDRSFFIKGYQMPVCARCTGVILGYMIAVPCFVLIGFNKFLSLVGGLVLFIDWLLQALNMLKSTNRRRLITGILGGFGIMSVQLFFISYFIHFFVKHRSI
jgi:uncharacterized membrane protein